MKFGYGTVAQNNRKNTAWYDQVSKSSSLDQQDLLDRESLLHGDEGGLSAFSKTQPELLKNRVDLQSVSILSMWWTGCKFFALFVIIMLPFIAYGLSRTWTSAQIASRKRFLTQPTLSAGETTPENSVISIYNEYSRYSTYSGFYPFGTIVEPFRITVLEVKNWSPYVTYNWYLDEQLLAVGPNVTVTFGSPIGRQQRITLHGIDSKGLRVVQESATVIVRYVRRELRELLAQDRVAFFQAVSIMQRVPTAAGRELYGANYGSKDYFNRIHLYFGANASCDHWHDGQGFPGSHFTLSLLFERSMQAINPSISLPYWDFTLESTFYEASTFRKSLVFADDWFSVPSPKNDMHAVDSGRFAFTPVMQNAVNFSRVVNPYGLLKAPWDSDPTPFLTRSSEVLGLRNNLKPTGCAEYHRSLQQRTWTDQALDLNFAAHGHVHELIGGSFGFRRPLPNATHTAASTGYVYGKHAYATVHYYQHSSQAWSKQLWRDGLLVCPTYGSPQCPVLPNRHFTSAMDTNEYCTCNCTAAMYESVSSIVKHLVDLNILGNMYYFDAKKDSSISPSDFKVTTVGSESRVDIKGYSQQESDDIIYQIRDYLCDFGRIGDMFEAASTNDVTFWVLHPTIERIWHLERLNSDKGLFAFNATWDDSTNTCPGHRSSDYTPFKNIFDDTGLVYRNDQLLQFLLPSNESLPFVYSHFRFHHCEALGFDMSGRDDYTRQ